MELGKKGRQVQAAVELNEERKRRTGEKHLFSGAEVHQLVRLGLPLFFFLNNFIPPLLTHPIPFITHAHGTPPCLKQLSSHHTQQPQPSPLPLPHPKTSLSPNYQQVLPSSSSLSSPPQPFPKPCSEVFSSPSQSQPPLEAPPSCQCIPHPSPLLPGQRNTENVGLSLAVCPETPCRINPSQKIPAAFFRLSYLPPSQRKMLRPLHGCQRAFKKGLCSKACVVEYIEIILDNHIRPRFSRERESHLDSWDW